MDTQSKSLISYFVTTMTISWGGMLLLGLPYGFPATQADFLKNWPLVFIPYLLGPLLSSAINTTVFYGKNGWKEFLALFRGAKTPWFVYAIGLASMPLLVTGVLLVLSLGDPHFVPKICSSPDRLGILLMGLSIGLFGGGFLEEPGWTAFATNTMMKKKWTALKTSLAIGLIWGIWHVLPTAWGSGDAQGRFEFMLLLPPLVFYVGVLPSYRAIMTQLFFKYQNIYVSILMHMALTATTLFIIVPDVSGTSLALYYLLLTCILLAANVILNRSIKGRTSERAQP
jgi:hypothetical protein